jgi:arsenate reductase
MSLPDDRTLLLHNPRCSKSRATKALLEERGVDFDVRLYLDEPLSRDELEELGRRLGMSPIEFTRTGEAAWKESGLDADAPDGAVLDALARTPILLQRPVLVREERAAIGRPPEQVLELVDQDGRPASGRPPAAC